MKFESQICTTKEQSERLLTLGLKKETADMYYHCIVCNEYPKYILMLGRAKRPLDTPAWSLHRLIELSGMGIIESTTDNLYDKVIQYIEYLIKCGNFNKEYVDE
jgi:hypothetical protein